MPAHMSYETRKTGPRSAYDQILNQIIANSDLPAFLPPTRPANIGEDAWNAYQAHVIESKSQKAISDEMGVSSHRVNDLIWQAHNRLYQNWENNKAFGPRTNHHDPQVLHVTLKNGTVVKITIEQEP